MTKIIGFGNALVDELVRLSSDGELSEMGLPKGGMTLVDSIQREQMAKWLSNTQTEKATGGSAANTILALSALWGETAFVGAVGNDELGHFFKQAQSEHGIESLLRVVEGNHTGVATTFITPDHERTFATHLGAAAMLSPDDIPLRKGDILHIEGYMVQNHDMIVRALEMVKAAGMTVSYDLASWNIVENDRDFIHRMVEQYVDIVFANEEEAAAYAQTKDMNAAAQMLAGQTHIAVVKLGKRGAIAWLHGEPEPVFTPTGKCSKVIDTTAAGDFFAAGYLYGHVNGCPLSTCLDYGHRIAGEVIQVMGTQVGADTLRKAVNA